MFERLERVIGIDNINKIKNKTIAIIGVGGVGGYVIETLVRNGINNIIIVDKDVVDITNKNRQIIALDTTINKSKVEVFKERILSINKECNVITLNMFLNEENKKELFKYDIDYLVDACDTVQTKIMLIRECLDRNIKIISSMGTGNKLDPKKLEITTLKKTSYDPLAKVIRHEINKLNITDDIFVLSSKEEIIKTHTRAPGSYSVVPNTAGILIADYIIKDIIKTED
ncbi:MAG: ThiF family adenylyltransferase [Bacilli bacterium]|nr:ThiF family adenylyltransferase [Bacilli bacterium]